jgi:hypothetical protein
MTSSLSVLNGRHGATNSAGRVRCNRLQRLLQLDVVKANFSARIVQLRRSRRPDASSLVPARRWGGLYRRVGSVAILGLRMNRTRCFSEGMGIADIKKPRLSRGFKQ